jgi:hypothetical protein
VSGFLNFDEKIIATTIKLAHAKVSKTVYKRLFCLIYNHDASQA